MCTLRQAKCDLMAPAYQAGEHLFLILRSSDPNRNSSQKSDHVAHGHGQVAARQHAKKRKHFLERCQPSAKLCGNIEFREVPRIERHVLLGWVLLAFIEFQSSRK